MFSIIGVLFKNVSIHTASRSPALFSGLFLAGLQLAGAADADGLPASKTVCTIFAGGVAGVEDLTVASNSTAFRAAGGGLYLHNNGWGELNLEQRKEVLEVFSNAPVAMELGFGGSTSSAKAWATACQQNYLDAGIKPVFIAANAFAGDNHPTPEQWAAYMAALRAAGVPASTLILPTFEYQNFRPNIATLAQNCVSQRADFQAIIRRAGGIVLDTPSGYFFSRETAYQDWVVDAIHWTRAHGLKTVVIASPHSSKEAFAADTGRYLDYLRTQQAVPDIFAVENYTPNAPPGYPNVVGNESRPNTALGVARMLQSITATSTPVGLTDGLPAQTLSLDGTWLFQPVKGRDQSATESELDALAQQLQNTPVTGTNWFPLAVPQFLNRYSWWLDISKKFVTADEARLATLPFDAEKNQAGWYLRQLVLPAGNAPVPEVVANFEGVAMRSRVYCNGHLVGQHTGMFGALDCRLTPFLRRGATNNLLVYAERGNTVKDADAVLGVAVTVPVTRGMLSSLNHGMFGGFGRSVVARFLGIWQPVTLKISQPGARISEVFFIPALDGHEIRFTLANANLQPAKGTVFCRVTDRTSGEQLDESAVPITQLVPAGGAQSGVISVRNLKPKLWTPDHPNLYQLSLEWRTEDGRLLDCWSEAVGYRTVQVKGAQLFLNGKPYWCRGAGQPVYGYKPTDNATAHGFLRLMHEGNEMVTRTGCNPWNDLWYSAADSEGVGVASEGVRPWALMSKTPPPEKALLGQWKQEQIETVRRYRNHASILFWCIANEGLQGDATNPEKIAIFRDIIDAVRRADPSRPVCQTSGDPDVAHNAEIEDVHSYWGWYESSSFVNDYTLPRRGLAGTPGHAFLNKECAVPYQDTDTGGVHPAYVGRYSAHPWVGEIGVRGTNTAYFAEHIRAEAKLKSEKLRYQRREQPTAGAMLFANTTWVQDVLTRPPAQWKPFPVWNAVRLGFAPVLLAWGTAQSVFFGGDLVQTKLFVVNDDADFRNLKNLSAQVTILDADGNSLAQQSQTLGDVNYFAVRNWPLRLRMPEPAGAATNMVPANVRLRLLQEGKTVAENFYPIRIASREWATAGQAALTVAAEGCGENELAQLQSMGLRLTTLKEAAAAARKADVVLLGPQATAITTDTACAALKPGGRMIVLEQGARAQRFFPDLIKREKAQAKKADAGSSLEDFMFENSPGSQTASSKVDGEFVEMVGWDQHRPMFDGLEAMDWKWWAQGEGRPAYVCAAAHRVDLQNPSVIALGRFLPPHFYWSGDLKKIYQAKQEYPVFAARRPWGELLVCELKLTGAITHDPRAAKSFNNLIRQPL